MSDVKAQCEADIFWHRLNGARAITGNVTLTPAQFRKQLTQAVKYGYKEGHAAGLKAKPAFNDHAADLMNEVFGKDTF